MAGHANGRTATRIVLVALSLVVPTLSLSVLGGLYLWEKGWMIWWALGALAVAAVSSLLLRGILPPPEVVTPPLDRTTAGPALPGHDCDSPLERRAWVDVRAIAERADTEQLSSFAALFALGQQTIEAVAARRHPQTPDAIWRFTLPVSLAIAERVSARLRLLTAMRIPFGDRLTMAASSSRRA